MTSDIKLGAAVIGLGVGEQHARAYAALGECELRWLCDRDLEKARDVAARLGVGTATARFSEVLTDPHTHVVSVCSFDRDHAEQVVAALNAGKHVFVEKPLAYTTDELRDIKKALARGHLHLGSNLVLRAAPLYRWLRETIRSGALGKIFAFDGDYLYGRLQKITDGWRKDVPDYSVMLGGGIHLIDLMLWLTGERPKMISATGNRIAAAGTAFKYNDFAAATFHFPSGLIGRITANFGCVHRHQHVLRVFGTKGTFIFDDAGARLHESSDPEVPPRTIKYAPLEAAKGDLIPEFVRAILEGRDAAAAIQHEFDLISACIAADRACALSETIPIAYLSDR